MESVDPTLFMEKMAILIDVIQSTKESTSGELVSEP